MQTYLSIRFSFANFISNGNHFIPYDSSSVRNWQLICVLHLQYLGQLYRLGFHSLPSTYGGSYVLSTYFSIKQWFIWEILQIIHIYNFNSKNSYKMLNTVVQFIQSVRKELQIFLHFGTGFQIFHCCVQNCIDIIEIFIIFMFIDLS